MHPKERVVYVLKEYVRAVDSIKEREHGCMWLFDRAGDGPAQDFSYYRSFTTGVVLPWKHYHLEPFCDANH